MNFSLTMKNKIRIWKTAVLAGTLLFLSRNGRGANASGHGSPG